MKPALTIHDVSVMTGLSSHTIRAWEKRYRVVRPARNGNRRAYSAHDVSRLEALRDLVAAGIPIGRAHQMSEAEIRETLPKHGALDQLATQRERLFDLIAHYDIENLSSELRWQRVTRGTDAFLIKLVLPVLAEIGRRVEAGKLNIAQEHVLSALIRDQIVRIRKTTPEAGFPKLAFATPEGDHHELGILVASKLAESQGFRTLYLGPNLPSASLIDIARACKPDVVVIAATPISRNFKSLQRYVRDVHKALSVGSKLWVGGPLAELVKKDARTLPDFSTYVEALEGLSKQVT